MNSKTFRVLAAVLIAAVAFSATACTSPETNDHEHPMAGQPHHHG